jgi:virginiamycin B lyase
MKRLLKTLPLLLLLALAAPAAAAPTVTEFPIPIGSGDPPAMPEGIVMGPDGKLWFTEQNGDKIGRVDPANPSAIQEFDLPAGLTDPINITVGPDNKLWFTGTFSGAGGVGRMNPADPTDTQAKGGYNVQGPKGIAAGSDGNIYMGDSIQGKVVAINPATMDKVPDGDTPINGGNFNIRSLTRGPDGNVWVTDFGGQVAKVTPQGIATAYNVPANSTWDIVTGPDGNLWYTAPDGADAVSGRITTGGNATEFPVTPGGDAHGIAAGPDGALWIAQPVANSIGRMTTDGQFTEIKGLTAGARPEWIASGPNNTMWFTEQDGNRIGRISGIELPQQGGQQPPPPPPDVTRPDVTRFRLTRTRFRLGSRGTLIKWTQSEAATVTLAFDRRVNGRWRRVRRKIRFESTAGSHRRRFRGRIDRRHPLKPGRYRMTLRAKDAAGNVSLPDRLRFRLLPRLG